MIKILQIIILVFFSLLMISASCDKGTEGCTDSTACNYDDSAAINDNSCWFASDGCDCEDPIGSTADCLGVCDADDSNNPPESENGSCDSTVVGGCVDELNCKYDEDESATHNDGSCTSDQSDFGGLSDGTDCNGDCGGTAVIDKCDICIGGLTNLGQSWRIKITSITSFKHHEENDILMGTDTNSVILGASIYALEGYNGNELNDGDPECENCYIDLPEQFSTDINNGNDSTRFYFPHDSYEDWGDWGSLVNADDIPVLQFDSDIRANDYHSLFTEEKGINWFAMIDPTFSDTTINVNEIPTQFIPVMDSIYFQISHLEGIKCSNIKFAIDREKGEIVSNFNHIVENNQLGISVDSGKAITVIINVSNICIQEQGYDQGEELLETCPDDF